MVSVVCWVILEADLEMENRCSLRSAPRISPHGGREGSRSAQMKLAHNQDLKWLDWQLWGWGGQMGS